MTHNPNVIYDAATDSVCFYNNGTLDKRAFTMLGLSAKSDDNKIGFFGTGFKYAIATLLRAGANIEIRVRDYDPNVDDEGHEYYEYTVYRFYAEAGRFRDRSFDFIYCDHNGEKIELPFTTHLGTNWQAWQAYRELYTNALDEGGGVEVMPNDCQNDEYNELGHVVIIVSDCQALLDVYKKHDTYFISDKVKTIVQSNYMRAVPLVAGAGNTVYYKTMFTGTQLDKPTVFTYDFVQKVQLTEDRTIAETWYIRNYIAELWTEQMTHDQLVEYLPTISNPNVYESTLNYDYVDLVSKQFITACEYLIKNHLALPIWARELYVKTRPFEERITSYKPTRYQQAQLNKALKVLDYHSCIIDPAIVIPCVSLPIDVLGYYKDNKLYIAKECFEKGFMTLLGTIYEEHLHHTKDLADTSRAMQNVLVDKCASLMIQSYEMDTLATATQGDEE